MSRLIALVAGLGVLAATRAAAFDPTGEVLFNASGGGASGATFDAQRLVGPSINMTRRQEGGWAGDVDGQELDLSVAEEAVKGANVNLTLHREGDRTQMQGLWLGRRVQLDVRSSQSVNGHFGRCSIDLERKGPGRFEGEVGCQRRAGGMPAVARGTLRLRGEAAQPTAPLPQLLLALIAVLPS
jgi:hypothetical protein